MKKTRTNYSEAQHNEIDRILATEDALVPSSGFLAAVMERVREEAAAPAPIPFPWKRALPGAIVIVGAFGAAAFELVRQGLQAAGEFTLTTPHISVAMERPLEQAGWIALALGVSLFSWLLSKRLAGRSGLL
jgi:hypothetical protein